MEASVLDLRKHMREVMSAIDRHERVTLLHRGRRRAVIVPLAETTGERPKVADSPAFGMWADRDDMAAPAAYVARLRQPRQS